MIKVIFMDVDGTLTDGKIYMGNDGELFKSFNIKDGYAIHSLLPKNNIIPVIITGRLSKIIEQRAFELGVKNVFQNVSDKCSIINKYLDENKIEYSQSAYIGDDLNDIPAMDLIVKNGGLVGCPNDAVEKIKQKANYICSKNAGEGAVREFIDYIIDSIDENK